MGQKRSKKFRHLNRKEALRIWRKENPAPREDKANRLYFGYGSNLDMAQMKRRCCDSIPLTKVFLPGQILSFSNVLTIEPDEESSVVGAIYLVSARDEKALDRYEGYPRTYSKRKTRMTLQGERKDVFYYTLNDPYTWGTPALYYYRTVARGYKDWGLDIAHLDAAYERAAAEEKRAREAHIAMWKDEDPMWAKSPNSAYDVLPDGTIDYLDWEPTRKDWKAWDDAWSDAIAADMEDEFRADYKRAGGWS